MSVRTTALGLLAPVAGAAALWFTEGTFGTVVGVLLLVLGAGVAVAAGLRGVRSRDPVRASVAEQHRDRTQGDAARRAMEQGQVPRMPGG